MSNNTANVTVGKPKTGGAVFRAAEGTTLPTKATVALSDDFVNMGYISDDGVTKAVNRENEEIKAWGGDTVLNPQTSYSETFTMTLIEALNPEVLKAVYGSKNVTGTLSTGVTVKGNSEELEGAAWVIDTVLTGNTASRIVIPHGKITEIGEVSYKDGEAVGYEITITATPDSNGNCRYEYLQTLTA